MKNLITYLLLLLIVFTGFGRTPNDSVTIYFRIDQSRYEPGYKNNGRVMESFVDKINKEKENDNIEKITVRGYASPDGSYESNIRLAQRRCTTIVNLLKKETGLSDSVIHSSPEGIAWDELREIVATTPEVPNQSRVLEILDEPLGIANPSDFTISEIRKKRLMNLGNGESYRWLYANVFPTLRCVGIVALYLKSSEEPQLIEVVDVSTVTETQECNLPEEAVQGAEAMGDTTLIDSRAQKMEKIKREKTDSRFALKTNLLDYVVLMPNIEIEWKFVDRWSAALEWQGAWYAKHTPHKVYRLSTVIPEVRFWAIEHSRWHGMYVGAFGGGGLYDLSNGKKGHEGEGWMAGVSIGYMWPISKHLSLDAGIGAGYLRARDKVYKPIDGHFLYQLTKNINYIGPLRLKLSLVWRIPH